MLDTVSTSLSQVGLSLQAALDLPGDLAKKRIEGVLDDLDDVIRKIRAAAFARDRPA